MCVCVCVCVIKNYFKYLIDDSKNNAQNPLNLKHRDHIFLIEVPCVAANLGVSKDDLQRLGGWISSDVPSRYVDLSLNKRIALSRSLMKNL